MTLYLTSSPCIDGADRPILNPANGFLARLQADLPQNPRCLFVASSPHDRGLTCHYGWHMFQAFAEAGMPFSSYAVLDWQSAGNARELIDGSDLIILAGGHVPTQNLFFNQLGLGALLADYPGVILGISAGTMNAASVVYAQPEEPGEGADPDFRRFLPGLGLTDINVCPHYQKVKDTILDGLRLFEDITYPDSQGRTFFLLPDGSYFYLRGGIPLLCGRAIRLRSGIAELLTLDGECACLSDLQ